MLCGIFVAIITTLAWQTNPVQGFDCITFEEAEEQLKRTVTALHKCILIEVTKGQDAEGVCPRIKVKLGLSKKPSVSNVYSESKEMW
ncbi:hypothetical protein ANCCAN_16624 [Ancylostoma caninum]|uniref:Cystatin domain-containing protein n=1 Tax=Ancylostoma caninum TaxID=29170 RepID=A0A368G185_ANCCA|nr:hypothetical protein ANCCAN_16624 [Ancylostoma caninum]